MIGNSTLHHLINDSLMPELGAFQKAILFKNIWREWRDQLSKTFIHPAKSFENVGLSYPRTLKNDWDLLHQYSKTIGEKLPLHLLFEFYPSQHRQQFYIAITWQCLHIQYNHLYTIIRNEESIQHQQYIFMQNMMDLEQLMDDNEQKLLNSHEKTIRNIFKQLMSFFWLKYESKYQDLLHLKSLRYFKEDLVHYIKTLNKNHDKFQEYLIDLLKEKPVLTRSDFEEMAPADIIADLKEDMEVIKEGVKHLQVPLKMEQDTYLKPKDAAEYLGIATSTLASWRSKGKLLKFKKLGNRYEYHREELERLKG